MPDCSVMDSNNLFFCLIFCLMHYFRLEWNAYLSYTFHLCIDLTCTAIKTEIWISFPSFLRRDSTLRKQKCSTVALFFWMRLNIFWTSLIYIYIYIGVGSYPSAEEIMSIFLSLSIGPSLYFFIISSTYNMILSGIDLFKNECLVF